MPLFNLIQELQYRPNSSCNKCVGTLNAKHWPGYKAGFIHLYDNMNKQFAFLTENQNKFPGAVAPPQPPKIFRGLRPAPAPAHLQTQDPPYATATELVDTARVQLLSNHRFWQPLAFWRVPWLLLICIHNIHSTIHSACGESTWHLSHSPVFLLYKPLKYC